MQPFEADAYLMDTQLAKKQPPGPQGFLKQCNHCLKVLDGATRTELFTRYGWHLRLNHYPDWRRP